MHAVMSRAFQQIYCSSYCFKRYEVPKGTKSSVGAFKVLFHLLYLRSPKGEGVYCFTSVRPSSFRPLKIFFVAFFSVSVDRRNLKFGHKRHIGIPYCG